MLEIRFDTMGMRVHNDESNTLRVVIDLYYLFISVRTKKNNNKNEQTANNKK